MTSGSVTVLHWFWKMCLCWICQEDYICVSTLREQTGTQAFFFFWYLKGNKNILLNLLSFGVYTDILLLQYCECSRRQTAKIRIFSLTYLLRKVDSFCLFVSFYINNHSNMFKHVLMSVHTEEWTLPHHLREKNHNKDEIYLQHKCVYYCTMCYSICDVLSIGRIPRLLTLMSPLIIVVLIVFSLFHSLLTTHS